MFGNEFDGSLAKAMDCRDRDCKDYVDPGESRDHIHKHPGPFYIVGPDPYTSRKWYGKLEYNTENNEWRLS